MSSFNLINEHLEKFKWTGNITLSKSYTYIKTTRNTKWN
ncbi:hypothetical protein [Bacillus phage FI_KG-Lek]|nr:hypothetical protein [Bacillus phage FI_KG-Lek]